MTPLLRNSLSVRRKQHLLANGVGVPRRFLIPFRCLAVSKNCSRDEFRASRTLVPEPCSGTIPANRPCCEQSATRIERRSKPGLQGKAGSPSGRSRVLLITILEARLQVGPFPVSLPDSTGPCRALWAAGLTCGCRAARGSICESSAVSASTAIRWFLTTRSDFRWQPKTGSWKEE